MQTPMIRVEMDRVRSSVMHYMGEQNDQFNEIVQETLKQTLTEDWVEL